MAGPLYCDATDCGEFADVIVSRIANGETMAWCDPHFVQMCQAVADSMVQAEVDATDAEALARLGGEADPEVFPTSTSSSVAGDPAAGQPSPPDSEPVEPVRGQDEGTDVSEAPRAVPAGRGRSSRAG